MAVAIQKKGLEKPESLRRGFDPVLAIDEAGIAACKSRATDGALKESPGAYLNWSLE